MFYNTETHMPIVKHFVYAIIGVIVALIILLNLPFSIVGAGERGVVLRFNAINRTLEPGLNWKIPFAEQVVHIDVTTQKEQVQAGAASKDLQSVNTTVAMNFNLATDKVDSLWRELKNDYKERVIDPAIQEAVKAATAKYNAEELITKREVLKEDIKIALRERLRTEYINVTDLSIVDFQFSPAFNQAIESKVTAEQNALAAKNKLEQVKYEAEQRIATAKGEAEAIKIQAEAITQQGGKDYVELKRVEKWNGSYPNTYVGGNSPLLLEVK